MLHYIQNLTLTEISGYLAAIISIAGSLGVIYAKLIHPMVMKMLNLCGLFVKTIVDASQIHEIIRKELVTPSGDSIKECLHRIEKKMFIQDNKHRAMLNLLERPVWEADEAGMFVWVNRFFLKTFGTDTEEIKNMGWISLVHPEDRERVTNEWADAVMQNRFFSTHYRMMKHGGQVVECLGEAFPIESVDHDGQEVSKKGFVGSLFSKKF